MLCFLATASSASAKSKPRHRSRSRRCSLSYTLVTASQTQQPQQQPQQQQQQQPISCMFNIFAQSPAVIARAVKALKQMCDKECTEIVLNSKAVQSTIAKLTSGQVTPLVVLLFMCIVLFSFYYLCVLFCYLSIIYVYSSVIFLLFICIVLLSFLLLGPLELLDWKYIQYSTIYTV